MTVFFTSLSVRSVDLVIVIVVIAGSGLADTGIITI